MLAHVAGLAALVVWVAVFVMMVLLTEREFRHDTDIVNTLTNVGFTLIALGMVIAQLIALTAGGMS